MSHEDFESSTAQGQPVELYLFRYGAAPNAFHAYTDAEQEVTHDEVVYAPIPVDRDKVGSDGRPARTDMKIRLPKTSAVAELFRMYPPAQPVTVVIRSGHLPSGETPPEWESDFPVVWVGRVTEGLRRQIEAVLTCEAAGTAMGKPGLRTHYQWACSHILYGPGCRAPKVPLIGTVVSAAGNRVVLQPGWNATGHDDARFVGGLFEWETEDGPSLRMILRVLPDNEFILGGPAIGLVPDDDVSVTLGCARTLVDCDALHGNTVNYGGFPWIPRDNPINKNNHG